MLGQPQSAPGASRAGRRKGAEFSLEVSHERAGPGTDFPALRAVAPNFSDGLRQPHQIGKSESVGRPI